MVFTIRVRAKTDIDQFRIITVYDDGTPPACDCDGFDGTICSHIDAVLIAEERAMVHPDDVPVVDAVLPRVRGTITIPDTWKGSWRRNMRWRGLSSRGPVRVRRRDTDKPLVCFTGKMPGGSREEMQTQAEENGWETIDSASPFTDVLVAADPMGSSAKLKKARSLGTPIVTPDEWTELMLDGVLPQ